MQRGELELHYQPIQSIVSSDVFSFEALLRWRDQSNEHPNIEDITTAAERGGIVFGLAEWAAKTAETDLRLWPSCDPMVRVNLNLSARHLVERNPVELFTRLAAEVQFNPSHFNLEITEKSFIRKPKNAVKILDELKAMGFGLWLDDFGTGHSSIEHLKYFPVDGLKIPSTYTKEMLVEERCGAIVRAMISTARALDISVVAEGIEKQEQLDFLKQHGCDAVQGFIFSEPLAAKDVPDYLSRHMTADHQTRSMEG